jgi:glycosyltransferase involved in cell wall biosynthesis
MKNEANLNVAVVTSTYARNHEDCQVPWMRELVRRVNGQVGSIRIFAPSYKGLADHEIDEVPVHRFRYAPVGMEALTHDEGAPNKSRKLAYKLLAIPYILLGIIAVTRWCLKHRIDVLHIHWPFPHGLWAIIPRYFFGVKVVAMSHGAELAIARRSGIVKRVLGWLLRTAHVRCANSSHTANEVKTVSGCEDTIITPYGATVAAKGAECTPTEVPTLLFCGRLIQRKGIDVLLKALPKVLAHQEVKIVITGEGDSKAEWQALSTRMNLDDVVTFAGFVSNEELADLYNQCTAYVHPAIFDDNGDTEGLGVVLIEALSYRKPVIASGVGGIVDVIKDGQTGLLVPEKDTTALADAIMRVLNDPELAARLGEQGYQHVETFFDWDRIAAQTLGIYSNVVNNPTALKAATLTA